MTRVALAPSASPGGQVRTRLIALAIELPGRAERQGPPTIALAIESASTAVIACAAGTMEAADLDMAALELRVPAWTRELLVLLTDRRRAAFVLREALGLTFDEISYRLDVSPSRASQLYAVAARVVTDAARRAALITQHVPVVVPHARPLGDHEMCAVPAEMQASLEMPIEALALGARGTNCLDNAGIKTVGDLVQKSEGEILKIMNLGRTTLREIRNALAGIGLHLGMDAGVCADTGNSDPTTPT